MTTVDRQRLRRHTGNSESVVAVFQAGADFRAALQRFARATEEICQRNGLTSDQYLLMLMVKGSRDGSTSTTVTELAERMALAHNSVTERVHRAEQSGLIEREPAAHDRRFKVVRLTARGDLLLSRAFSELGEESVRLMTYISEVRQLAERLGPSREPRS